MSSGAQQPWLGSTHTAFVFGTFALHELHWLVCNGLLALLDASGWLRRYRIQGDRFPPRERIPACLALVAFNHFGVQLPGLLMVRGAPVGCRCAATLVWGGWAYLRRGGGVGGACRSGPSSSQRGAGSMPAPARCPVRACWRASCCSGCCWRTRFSTGCTAASTTAVSWPRHEGRCLDASALAARMPRGGRGGGRHR
jgi:hypothetical protein